MPRALPIVALVLTLLASGCSGGGDSASTKAAGPTAVPTTSAAPAATKIEGTIVLRASGTNVGPWSTALSLKLRGNLVPHTFFVCAVWRHTRPGQPCRAAAGARLPDGTALRLEQRPSSASTGANASGWETVATSQDAELHAVLSNFVSGNAPGTVAYRVTLHDISGGPSLATSNRLEVTWR